MNGRGMKHGRTRNQDGLRPHVTDIPGILQRKIRERDSEKQAVLFSANLFL
jgi:hypothetical protein